MTKNDIIKQIATELMYEDEWLEYADAMEKATLIYYSLYAKDDEDVL